MIARQRDTTAILPVKRFSLAKSRLRGSAAGDVGRALLSAAMFTDVLDALARTSGISAIIVVTADPQAAALARGAGARVVHDRMESSHSQATELGVRRALNDGAGRVLIVSGDCPLIDPAELDGLIARAPAAPSVVVVLDCHGDGTNAPLLAPPDVIQPSFGAPSRHRHEQLAHAAGACCRVVRVPTIALDVDSPDDIAELRGTAERMRRARHSSLALQHLGGA